MYKVFTLISLGLLLLLEASARPLSQPKITRVFLDGSHLLVDATVPAGIVKVTLQSRDRLEGSSWVPRAVARLDGVAGTVTFQLPISAQFELLRVRADNSDPLPASFYQGTNSFTAQPSSSSLFFNDSLNPATGMEDSNPGAEQRTVVESDIWKVQGDTIYFFNAYRGLQVIDVTDPAAPSIKGSYEIPAVGEQMYLHRSHAVLLARNGCGWWGDDSESRIVIINLSSPALTLAASLPIRGYIQESRMVGDVLYIAAQTYRTQENSAIWEWGTTIHSFDLANPAQPVSKATLWFPGYGNTISATDQFLFVVTTDQSNWSQSILNLVDISSPTGEMISKGVVRPNGRIADKFKMNLSGDTLTVISHGLNSSNQWISILQTFSITDPLQPVKLASLELAPNEQLHATRFDGNRVYVVTFFRVDPLWIVDLSDPAKPRILSELEVPGWSTYLHPMGDRLLAVGIETTNGWRTTISLFDVADPAQPALLDREFLGEGWSWSEANNDEKAFSVLENDGLVLVPYSGHVTNGYVTQVQLIDLNRDSLSKRGVIDHRLQPRRATLHKNHVLSLSARELISVDAVNRDQPQVKADLPLSWTVDRLLVSGDHLIQIEAGQSWWWNNASSKPRLLVSAKSSPTTPLNTVTLSRDWPIAGATLKDGFLYLAQAPFSAWWMADSTAGDAKTNNFLTTVLDARNLPALSVATTVELATDSLGTTSLDALWPTPGLLVWSSGAGGYYPWWGWGIEGDVVALARQAFMPIWWGGAPGGRFLAFKVAEPGHPQFASSLNLAGTNQWWNYSKSIVAAENLVYTSHQASEFLPDVIAPWSKPYITYDATTGQQITNDPPKGMWVTKHFLDVIDFTDPANPAVRAPANIPGLLKDTSHDGAMLYTVFYHYDASFNTDYSEWVDALAYDGVSAHLVDSLKLPTEWPRSYALAGGNVFLSRPNSTNPPPAVEHWTISSTGKFALQNRAILNQPAHNMTIAGDFLTIVTSNSVQLYPTSGIAIPKPIGMSSFSSCYYLDLTKAVAEPNGVWLPLGDYGILNVPATLR